MLGMVLFTKLTPNPDYASNVLPGLVVTALWFVIYWQFRAAFYGIFFTETQSDRS